MTYPPSARRCHLHLNRAHLAHFYLLITTDLDSLHTVHTDALDATDFRVCMPPTSVAARPYRQVIGRADINGL